MRDPPSFFETFYRHQGLRGFDRVCSLGYSDFVHVSRHARSRVMGHEHDASLRSRPVWSFVNEALVEGWDRVRFQDVPISAFIFPGAASASPWSPWVWFYNETKSSNVSNATASGAADGRRHAWHMADMFYNITGMWKPVLELNLDAYRAERERILEC